MVLSPHPVSKLPRGIGGRVKLVRVPQLKVVCALHRVVVTDRRATLLAKHAGNAAKEGRVVGLAALLLERLLLVCLLVSHATELAGAGVALLALKPLRLCLGIVAIVNTLAGGLLKLLLLLLELLERVSAATLVRHAAILAGASARLRHHLGADVIAARLWGRLSPWNTTTHYRPPFAICASTIFACSRAASWRFISNSCSRCWPSR